MMTYTMCNSHFVASCFCCTFYCLVADQRWYCFSSVVVVPVVYLSDLFEPCQSRLCTSARQRSGLLIYTMSSALVLQHLFSMQTKQILVLIQTGYGVAPGKQNGNCESRLRDANTLVDLDERLELKRRD